MKRKQTPSTADERFGDATAALSVEDRHQVLSQLMKWQAQEPMSTYIPRFRASPGNAALRFRAEDFPEYSYPRETITLASVSPGTRSDFHNSLQFPGVSSDAYHTTWRQPLGTRVGMYNRGSPDDGATFVGGRNSTHFGDDAIKQAHAASKAQWTEAKLRAYESRTGQLRKRDNETLDAFKARVASQPRDDQGRWTQQ